jgi:hypothetical protein
MPMPMQPGTVEMQMQQRQRSREAEYGRQSTTGRVRQTKRPIKVFRDPLPTWHIQVTQIHSLTGLSSGHTDVQS